MGNPAGARYEGENSLPFLSNGSVRPKPSGWLDSVPTWHAVFEN